MKAIETNATLTEHGQLTLDEPLTLARHSRVIVLVSADGEDPDDTPIGEIREGLYQGWQDVLAGRTKPVSQLWEGMDLETLALEGLNSGPSTPMTTDDRVHIRAAVRQNLSPGA